MTHRTMSERSTSELHPAPTDHSVEGLQIDPHGAPIELFLVPPVLHNWCNKDHSIYYPVCGMVHIKDPLLIIKKKSCLCCGGSGFPLAI